MQRKNITQEGKTITLYTGEASCLGAPWHFHRCSVSHRKKKLSNKQLPPTHTIKESSPTFPSPSNQVISQRTAVEWGYSPAVLAAGWPCIRGDSTESQPWAASTDSALRSRRERRLKVTPAAFVEVMDSLGVGTDTHRSWPGGREQKKIPNPFATRHS